MKIYKNSIFLKSIVLFSLSLSYTTSITFADKNSSTDSLILAQDGDDTVTQGEAFNIIQEMSIPQRHLALNDPKKFQNYLLDLLTLKKKAKESKKLLLHNSESTKWLFKKYQYQILSSALIDKFKNEIVYPDDLELLAKEQYDAHPEKYIIQEKIKAAHILLLIRPTADTDTKKSKLELMNTIISQIKNGLDFSEAAKQFSEDIGSAKTGGALNHFPRGTMVKPFEEAAFNLSSIGDMSGIIETKFGLHIIKLLDRVEQSVIPFDKVKEKLVKIQKDKYLSNQVRNYTNSFDSTDNTTLYIPPIQTTIAEAKKNFLP